MPIDRRGVARRAAALAALLSLASPSWSNAQSIGAPALRAALAGSPKAMFTPAQACDGDDVPDVNARAFRDATGQTTVFALHELNRALRGPDLDHLKIDCSIPYQGHQNADPAAYDDHAWIASIWTENGRTVSALAHHEYHASEHPGRCVSRDFMSCWYNTILELRSTDGGRTFVKARNPVVAASPFRQDVDQTRHRGFFNPSNIIGYRGAWYFFASTTGWPGQDYGACLFRSRTPADPSSWRAYDGRAFDIRYRDPYGPPAPAPRPCAIIAPFRVPVGAVVRYRPTGDFLAVWQAHADSGFFPVSGFYLATSRDLLHWSDPRLLLAGPTLYDDACRSGGRLINYPSLLDDKAQTRDYEDIGAHAWLVYASLRVDGCQVTSDRVLLRQALVISPASNEDSETLR
jgi:hypothetical protein